MWGYDDLNVVDADAAAGATIFNAAANVSAADSDADGSNGEARMETSEKYLCRIATTIGCDKHKRGSEDEDSSTKDELGIVKCKNY